VSETLIVFVSSLITLDGEDVDILSSLEARLRFSYVSLALYLLVTGAFLFFGLCVYARGRALLEAGRDVVGQNGPP
jgi:hypothetical protein